MDQLVQRAQPVLPLLVHRYLWNFAGQVANKRTRRMMIEQARELGNGFEHITSRWGDAAALNTSAYRQVLTESKVWLQTMVQ